MSSKAKWKESFQKTKSYSQASSASVTRKTSLLDEGDLSVSDDELEQYLGTIKKKSGLNRLWTGNAFDRVIDRTPDVSISSISDGEVPIDEEDKNPNSDNDFLPNVMALPSMGTDENDSKISEPSSIKPLQAINFMSDLEQSHAPLEPADNVKLALSGQESEVASGNVVKTASRDLSSAEEVQTLDEISEEIEEDLSQGSKQNTKSNYSSKKDNSHRPKNSRKSEQSTFDETDHTFQSSSRDKRHSRKSRTGSRHSRSDSKSKHSSQYTSEDSSLHDSTSQKQKKTHSRHSKAESSRHSKRKTDTSLTESDVSYTADFSESSKQTDTESSRKSSLGSGSAVSSTKVKSIAEIGKKTSKHKMNQCYHDVGTQVNIDDVTRPQLGVGMATLGPSLGHRYVDPSPIARHVVDADSIEAVTAYNPAVVALTDMLRQQLKLVEQFVDNSRRMYESYTNNLNTTYRYTTVEDTLQYINENGDRHST